MTRKPLISGRAAQLYATYLARRVESCPFGPVIVIIFISFAPRFFFSFPEGLTSPLLGHGRERKRKKRHLVLMRVGRPDVMTGLREGDAPP